MSTSKEERIRYARDNAQHRLDAERRRAPWNTRLIDFLRGHLESMDARLAAYRLSGSTNPRRNSRKRRRARRRSRR